MRLLRSWLIAAMAAPALAGPAAACGASDACAVEGGYYLVRAPSGWDGRSKLPAVMFFHGEGESADSVMKHEDLARRMDGSGALLIAPHGEGKTWSFPASPARHRNELDFTYAVVEDVSQRYPIDRERFIASGFSHGASMVWHLACNLGLHFSGFAPIAGAFWRPHPTRCPAGAVNLRHVHGRNDADFPMEGRAIEDGAYRQGDVRKGLSIFLAKNFCRPEPKVQISAGLGCEVWSDCASGREIGLCLHGGGHDFDARFVEDALRWMDDLASAQKQ